ncbi:MAG: hypothetical protein ABIG30_00875 [Candidatus Aenigmatarchaeota archaeon]
MGQAILKKDIGSLRKQAKGEKEIMQLNESLVKTGIEWSKERMKSVSDDKILVQASNALEHLNKVVNETIERLREWYLLVDSAFEANNDNEFVRNIIARKEDDIFTSYALLIQELQNKKKELERFIKEQSKEVMPNFSTLLNPLIAAKLLAMAGSLEKLARMTSGTIQLLGAEKALFRHLKDKSISSPKYGIIYNATFIQNASDEQKGKVARLLAAKLMMAARIDFYSKRDESQKMLKELEEDIKKLGDRR